MSPDRASDLPAYHSSSVAASGIVAGSSAAPDRVAFNRAGIFMGSGSTGNALRGSEFFDNEELTIGLGNNDVTPNGIGDADTGANELQNVPVLTPTRRRDGQLRIIGTIDRPVSPVIVLYTLAFDANATCEDSGHGESGLPIGEQAFLLFENGFDDAP